MICFLDCKRHPTAGALMLVIAAGIAGYSDGSAAGWLDKGRELFGAFGRNSATSSVLTDTDIGAGLKEALRIGTETVVGQLGRVNGFREDPAVHIPLPSSLRKVQSVMDKVGMGSMLNDLEVQLNRAAEVATPKAKALFWRSIEQMTLDDVRAIYNGPEDAATRFFQGKMSDSLKEEMRPIVSNSMAQVGAVNTYDKVMKRYQSLPFTPDIKTDLTEHVLNKGLEGIFYYLAKEEAAIRKDPVKRTTGLLQKVFGNK